MKTFDPQEIVSSLNKVINLDQKLVGMDYLKAIAKQIAITFGIKYILIGHAIEPANSRIQTDVVWAGDDYHENFIYDLKGTPCELVLSGNRVCMYPGHVTQQFPDDTLLVEMGVEAYIGTPILDRQGKLQGLLVLLHNEIIDDQGFFQSIIEFLGSRIGAELEKYYSEEHLKAQVAEKTKELEETNQQLRTALEERKTLIYEIHHRVKNNFSVISSLLSLQAQKTDDSVSKSILMDSRNRVISMSKIHQMLYQSDNMYSIDMNEYFKLLVNDLKSNYTFGKNISLIINSENILLSVQQASTLGLIINELVTNSFKYAFLEAQNGEICINLQNTENQIFLEYADNGIGIPESFDIKKTDSLGLKLVKTLAENQLDGSIDMESNNGTKFTIKFNIET
jgi:two-component sensor histidine kinase